MLAYLLLKILVCNVSQLNSEIHIDFVHKPGIGNGIKLSEYRQ